MSSALPIPSPATAADTPSRLQAIEAELGAMRNTLLSRNDAVQLLQQLLNLLLQRSIDDTRNQRIALVGIEDRQYDLLKLVTERLTSGETQAEVLRVVTDHPVAIASADHIQPRGTKADNTRSPRFVARCESVFGGKIAHMDLGCAGGGLVWDFHLAGHRSIGIEGSDYSLLEKRAFWSLIPDRLFTADITKPFRVEKPDGSPAAFDVITAWEVLEHIGERDLPAMFSNIRNALSDRGLFVASVATFDDRDPATGAVWHVTVQPRQWWAERFTAAGLTVVDVHPFTHHDFVRGAGNPRAWDWDAAVNPNMGFHIVARRSS